MRRDRKKLLDHLYGGNSQPSVGGMDSSIGRTCPEKRSSECIFIYKRGIIHIIYYDNQLCDGRKGLGPLMNQLDDSGGIKSYTIVRHRHTSRSFFKYVRIGADRRIVILTIRPDHRQYIDKRSSRVP